ncbi:MAG: hypothetical protein O2780_15810 [Proteobacteria bacterium]|nr:hypothetical protein [Pseudomonadota bacterium]MDA1298903.1 hypothetical protein [Pseudomonadota bacterium]
MLRTATLSLISVWMLALAPMTAATPACKNNPDWPACQIYRQSLSECIATTSDEQACVARTINLYDAELKALIVAFPEMRPLFDQVPTSLCESYSDKWKQISTRRFNSICPTAAQIAAGDQRVPRACVRVRVDLLGRPDDYHALDLSTDRAPLLLRCQERNFPTYCQIDGWTRSYQHPDIAARFIHPLQFVSTLATRQATSDLIRQHQASAGRAPVIRRAVAFRTRLDLSTLYTSNGQGVLQPEDFDLFRTACLKQP